MQSDVRHFSSVSLEKIKLKKNNLHQMNYWKVYFLAYLIKNVQKVNMVAPMYKNVWSKRYGGPCKAAADSDSQMATMVRLNGSLSSIIITSGLNCLYGSTSLSGFFDDI